MPLSPIISVNFTIWLMELEMKEEIVAIIKESGMGESIVRTIMTQDMTNIMNLIDLTLFGVR